MIDSFNHRIALKFDMRIDSTAAEAPVKFQNDSTILNIHRMASRLCEILPYDVLYDTETGPWKINGDTKTCGLQTYTENVVFVNWPSCSKQLHSFNGDHAVSSQVVR